LRLTHFNSRIGRSLLSMLLLAGYAAGQTAATTAPVAKAKPGRVMMWKVSSPTATVYLFGSIHLAVKEMYPLPQSVESAFDSAKILAVEVNIKRMAEGDMLSMVQQYGIYPEGDSLTKHLPAATVAALDQFCAEYGFPREGMERMKPWMVTTLVSVLPYVKIGADPKLGLDLHFLERAKETQKIDEFETADFQFALLSSGTESQQIELLNSALKHASRAPDFRLRVIKAYQTGDPAGVEEVLLEQAAEARWFYKLAIDDRNIKMADKVEAYLQGKDPVFVVIGLGHLVGDKGVLKLLQSKKYNVQQMTE
jgi:uncharacterized protein